jgi:hypothetical protein
MITKPGRYFRHELDEAMGFLLNLRDLATQTLRDKDLNNIKVFLKRFELYFAKNKIASKLSIEPLIDKNSQHIGARVSAFSDYVNLSFESAKNFAVIFSILGVKVITFRYNPEDNYFRMDALPTNLLFKKGVVKIIKTCWILNSSFPI